MFTLGQNHFKLQVWGLNIKNIESLSCSAVPVWSAEIPSEGQICPLVHWKHLLVLKTVSHIPQSWMKVSSWASFKYPASLAAPQLTQAFVTQAPPPSRPASAKHSHFLNIFPFPCLTSSDLGARLWNEGEGCRLIGAGPGRGRLVYHWSRSTAGPTSICLFP